MQKLKAIIVEDEAPSRERLKSLLSDIPDIELIGEAVDGPEGVQLIDKMTPDIAFLDIQLPVFTSFELLKRIKHQPLIIFITAYDAYAVKAFEANAIDYLLKPTTPERLRKAIDRVRTRQPISTDKLLDVVQRAAGLTEYPDRFTVKCGSEISFIPADAVCWFGAQDKYVFLHTSNDSLLYEDTLKTLEQRLNPKHFIRIHKSVIINTAYVNRIKRTDSGNYQVEMKDAGNTRLEIGRTYLANVRTHFEF